MSEPTQKQAFLDSEGDRFYERNRNVLEPTGESAAKDRVLGAINAANFQPRSVLEIGCSNGWRIEALRKSRGAKCHGIDPSADAIRDGRALFPELALEQGTADALPFADNTFDLLIFGFCLYLCDRKDLFKIACESDRVLNDDGHIAILDFHPPFAYRNEYKHLAGMSSYKMNYATMFSWNPAYTLLSQTAFNHDGRDETPMPDDRLSVSILRKDTRHAYPENPFTR